MDLVAHHLKIIDKVCEHTTPDFMTFAEDMSYNNGSMLSKELFDEFMKPYYPELTICPFYNRKLNALLLSLDIVVLSCF